MILLNKTKYRMNFEGTKEKLWEHGERYLPRFDDSWPPEVRKLREASRYTTLNRSAGLKRPLLTIASSQMYEISEDISMRLAWTSEFVHSSSLIMDDLECMDDATLRRGKRACHLQYGTHTAVLASHDLRTEAERLISDSRLSNYQKVELQKELIRASEGLLSGQMIDLRGKDDSLDVILRMHALKTGALIAYALRVPAVAKRDDLKWHQRYILPLKSKDQENIDRDLMMLEKVGIDLGILYQAADDLKDTNCQMKDIGKDVFVDRRNLVTALQGDERKVKEIMAKKALSIHENLRKLSRKPTDLADFLNDIIESAMKL